MKLIIDELIEEKRLDLYLADFLQDFSRSKIQSEIKQGNITVNSNVVKPSYIIKTNDVINVVVGAVPEIPAENIPLDIVWEDNNMLVVNKPSGMLTHPTSLETRGTLVNALLYKYGNDLSDVNGEFRRGIVHRLDRNTSGLLMVAKNNKTHDFLAKKIKEHDITKTYYAVVKGLIKEQAFIINKPIGRNPKQPHKMAVVEGGKESISKVRVIEYLKDATFIEIELVTGRTHQIRVHMSNAGHPVYNDTLYGFGKMKIKTDEQVLQSYKLIFPRPFSGEKILVEIPPDEKINKILNFLR